MRYQIVAYMTDLFTQRHYAAAAYQKSCGITKVSDDKWLYPKINVSERLNDIHRALTTLSDTKDYYYAVEEDQ